MFRRISIIIALIGLGCSSSTEIDLPAVPDEAAEWGVRTVVEEATVVVGPLRWQQCSYGQSALEGDQAALLLRSAGVSVRVGDTDYFCTGEARSLNWYQANDFCGSLGLAGFAWRLPLPEELKGILWSDRPVLPLISTAEFPGTPAADYWTSLAYQGSDRSAWIVDFFHGDARGELLTRNAYVRCVSDTGSVAPASGPEGEENVLERPDAESTPPETRPVEQSAPEESESPTEPPETPASGQP
ncbi:MAG: DUF1566 domain-containing protein [Spirochaetales bacterium]|nr:DUF1566 domain-containing protein [Spirochaetales bacterium]